MADELKGELNKTSDEAKKKVGEQFEKAKEKAQKVREKARVYIRENPEKSAFIAAGVGMAIGLTLAGMAVTGAVMTKKCNRW